ncbi:ABC-type Fe3+-hydroxamate transport system, periplasmic component [Halanaeroarchaeum sp. HSR-CO]|nr:ABC-type Fe3+-hydroxamate transport system, periplasmic component [Halanaeroarchaeum sp. HSR-CO]
MGTNRRELLRAVAGIGSAGLAGCLDTAATSGATTETVELTDGANRTVAVPRTVDRLVAIGPGALRQVAYLDAMDRVVGVERGEHTDHRTLPYNLANPRLQDLPVVGPSGPDAGGNAEALLGVEPDLLLVSAISGADAADRLESQTGVPTVVLSMPFPVDDASHEALYAMWRRLGSVLGVETRAKRVIEFVSQTVADLRSRAPDRAAATAFAGGVSYKGAQGFATTRVPYPPFWYAGAGNVASPIESVGVSVNVDVEQLLAWDPDAVFVSAANVDLVREDLRSHPELRSLTAFDRENAFSLLPVSHYHENVGSMLLNGYFVGRTLYPAAFDDVDPASTAAEIYRALLGTAVYDEVVAASPAYERFSPERSGQ